MPQVGKIICNWYEQGSRQEGTWYSPLGRRAHRRERERQIAEQSCRGRLGVGHTGQDECRGLP